MAATGIWFGNEAWPSGRSAGDFARDVFRIEGCTTDKQRAMAFYKWMIRCMNRGPNFYVAGGTGTYERCFNADLLFTGWGSHECTGWGWIGAEALCAAGLKARRVVCHNNGHTIYEVFYKGDDGVESWHAFDPFAGWYFVNRRGEVASCEELAADHSLAQSPLPGSAQPSGHIWERNSQAHRHRMESALVIDQPIRRERLAWDLLPGQSVSNLWRPADPAYALIACDNSPPGERGQAAPDGAHDTMPQYDHEGRLLYPEHEPYWRAYRWPASRRIEPAPGEGVITASHHDLVRWHGCGSLRWKPLPFGQSAAARCANAKFENGSLAPTGPNHWAEVWYRFRLPYPISYLALDTDFSGTGTVGIAISADGGDSLASLYWGPPKWLRVLNGKADYLAGKPSVQGLREFWLRIDMESRDVVRMNALRIMVGYQHNMHVQPRLLPGENPLFLEAPELAAGRKLSCRWNYTTPTGEAEQS
ncbi:MAG: hypothetical protein PHU85_11340, partial [Phycisphaerae bacterium]|nr:hypothetical protein [Phycisphaerae bacterium]